MEVVSLLILTKAERQLTAHMVQEVTPDLALKNKVDIRPSRRLYQSKKMKRKCIPHS
jgi:hypothetical protein